MQRRKVLLVDGYNVIRNNARYASQEDDFESASMWNKARQTLVNDAALMAHGAYEHCTVVFDGAGNAASTGEPRHVAGIDVMFSPAGVSADTVIERLAHDARERGFEAVVVSSDFAIQSTVFGAGVTRMSATGFAGAADELEQEWSAGDPHARQRSTVAGRIDKGVAAKLEAFVRGDGPLT